MPIYAYKCSNCEHDFKAFHAVDEAPGNCPKCSTDSLKKQFLPSNIATVEEKKDSAKNRIEKYIEETRASIREQIEESRKEYNP